MFLKLKQIQYCNCRLAFLYCYCKVIFVAVVFNEKKQKLGFKSFHIRLRWVRLLSRSRTLIFFARNNVYMKSIFMLWASRFKCTTRYPPSPTPSNQHLFLLTELSQKVPFESGIL
jgi:hypothetical protein